MIRPATAVMPARNGHLAPPGKFVACHEAVAVNGRAPDYLFGQSAGEAERLRLQARMFAPYTARFLQDAGISPSVALCWDCVCAVPDL